MTRLTRDRIRPVTHVMVYERTMYNGNASTVFFVVVGWFLLF